MDYLAKLSKDELAWLNKFMDEFNGANLDYKNLKKNLHKTKRLKKDCTDKNNARNRCIYSKRIKFASDTFNMKDYDQASDNPEDALIECIDARNKKKKKL